MHDAAPPGAPGWWRRLWPPRQTPEAADAPVTAPTAPRFGRYQATAVLGEGASGPVYLAQAGEQSAAIKVLALDPRLNPREQADLRQRFLRQAEIMRTVSHPDIVALLDSGETEGRPWVAMEVAPGTDLTRYTRTNRLLPEPLALRIGARVARALAHAHRHGIVHRDLKPANVRIDLSTDQLKLLDFGVARLEDAQVTRTGVTLGTPAYMAPEQLVGETAGPAGDTYALGVMLYELLTGHLPYPATHLGELLRAVAAGTPAPLRHWRPELPEGLEQFLGTLLKALPQARPADLDRLADELEHWATLLQRPAPS
ncbi:serine/threonine protein kinase [Aquincola sp. S2]|uniref:Serine/threonine protein kinase n=1 Tax=Pseudaquabacterium terrae TaxID=2732868 RepID=A0ABX2EKR6_9BURK|nr:serine/threonine-protein kinase [Aquabacterium terrae]NRF69193.1 serine/threonine protein kinase [Aquabacterium terrae]